MAEKKQTKENKQTNKYRKFKQNSTCTCPKIPFSKNYQKVNCFKMQIN